MGPSGVERYAPVAYFGLALALILTIIPTALRPPEPPPPTSAEFSPDAPPDEQQTIVSELGRAGSATAGSGPPAIAPGLPPAALAPGPARSCPLGFGNPPRQTESLYAAPCAPS